VESLLQTLVSPPVIDLILLAVIVEGAVLLLLYRFSGRGIPPGKLLPNLIAGGCLFLALRLVLADAAAHWVALSLLAALVAHVSELVLRWQR
jgi:membrane-bound ClpP family serine protease